MQDFSFQGKIYLGTRLPGGKPGKLTWVGDTTSCEVALATESEDRTETFSGNRLQSARLRTATTATITLVLRYFNAETLALGLYSAVNNVAAGSVAAERLPPDLAAGDIIALDHGRISNLVITDSATTPVELDEGTHYAIESPQGGIVRILNPGTLTQPFKAAYGYAAIQSAALFTVPPPERYFLIDGVNTIGGQRVRAHLYRAQFDPAGSIPLINESFGELSLTGAALFDSDAALDPALGGFGRFELQGL